MAQGGKLPIRGNPTLPAQWDILRTEPIEPQDVVKPEDNAETLSNRPNQTLISTQTITHEYLTLSGKVVRETVKVNGSVTEILDFLYDESLNIGRLLHGGIYLITEREEDAVEISGTISSIENLSRFSFPELNKEYRSVQPNGAKIMVGDIPCVATSSGDFAVGDYVTVLYLPQSKYVLSIEKVSHNT